MYWVCEDESGIFLTDCKSTALTYYNVMRWFTKRDEEGEIRQIDAREAEAIVLAVRAEEEQEAEAII